jgi:hypothetical protein
MTCLLRGQECGAMNLLGDKGYTIIGNGGWLQIRMENTTFLKFFTTRNTKEVDLLWKKVQIIYNKSQPCHIGWLFFYYKKKQWECCLRQCDKLQLVINGVTKGDGL